MDLQKYVGRHVEIIYIDQKDRITQRQIRVYTVKNGAVQAFDTKKHALRSFTADRVLAAMPLHRYRPVSGLSDPISIEYPETRRLLCREWSRS